MTNDEIIKKVNEWQNAGFVHELTCGFSSSHGALVPKDVLGTVHLHCPNFLCDYVQKNIPAAVLEADIPAQKAELEARFPKGMKASRKLK